MILLLLEFVLAIMGLKLAMLVLDLVPAIVGHRGPHGGHLGLHSRPARHVANVLACNLSLATGKVWPGYGQ